MSSIVTVVEPRVDVFWSSARKRAWVYVLMWFLVSVFALVILFRETLRDLTFAPFAGLFLLAMLYNTFFLHSVLLRTRLEISARGLRYHFVRYELSATWSQVTQLESTRVLGIWPHSFLRVQAPTIRTKFWFDPPPRLEFLSRRDRVPIGAGVWERNEELLEHIRRYAPQIDAAA